MQTSAIQSIQTQNLKTFGFALQLNAAAERGDMSTITQLIGNRAGDENSSTGGVGLQTGSSIDRVADGSIVHVLLRTHVTHNRRSKVHTYANAKFLADFSLKFI